MTVRLVDFRPEDERVRERRCREERERKESFLSSLRLEPTYNRGGTLPRHQFFLRGQGPRRGLIKSQDSHPGP